MKNILWLLPLLLLSCKKDNTNRLITISNQPVKISIYDVDTFTEIETLVYDIRYSFSNGKFDSIRVAGIPYILNYSLFDSVPIILLNYTGPSQPYAEITLDPGYISLQRYKEFNSADSVTVALSYTMANRIGSMAYSSNITSNNFTRNYSFRNDTVIITSARVSDNCASADTVINSLYETDPGFPWLLLVENGQCGAIGPNILRALPVSNFKHKLPFLVRNGNVRSSFAYSGDQYGRLAIAGITQKSVSTGATISKVRIRVDY